MITEYELYSDERSISFSGRRYLFVGGVVCTQTGRDRLLYSISQVQSSHHLSREMKWGKVSFRYLEAYKSWVDIFFDDPFSRFSVLWLESSSPDWQSFTPRPDRRASKDDRLASIFYQFLLITFGPLRDMKRWWVYPDMGLFSRDTMLYRIEFLFNRTYKKAFGPKSSRIIRLARSRDSHRTDLVQLADVLLGAFTFRILGYEPDSPAKRHLARYCSARLDSKPHTRRGLEKLMVKKWQPPDHFKFTYGKSPSNNDM